MTRYPEQRQKWWADFDAVSHSAVEEIVRWASPVIYMRRTLTRDFELSGTTMAAGDKATLWYCSANRDESKFFDPWMSDVTPRSESARRIRRRGCALLPGCQSGSPRDPGHVRGTVP